MKKTIVTIVAALVSQTAFAGDLYCGTNVEGVPGSGVYNKSVFWEKVDTSKPTTHFLLADGTLLRQEAFTPDALKKVVNGTLAIGISFSSQGRPQAFLGRVKRSKDGAIIFKNIAIASSMDSNSTLLMANGASLICKEM